MGKSKDKGFVLTTDALLSVMILAIFGAEVAYLSSHPYPDYTLLDLERKAGDTLSIMQKNGYINSENQSLMTSFLDNMTRGNGWRIYLEYYNKTGSGTETEFVLDKVMEFGGNDSAAMTEAVVERIFITTQGNATVHYGRVRLMEWIG